jgi:hypothetical protein
MVVKDMKNHTYPLSGAPPNDKVGTSSTKDGPTTLVAEGTGVFLVPSIMCLQVDEPNMRLQIQGDFGDKYTPPGPGTVKLYSSVDRKGGSTSLSVVMWSRVMITCVLPSGSPGASTTGTSGYVVVEVSGRESNAVPLTEWSGQILATASGDQSIQEKGTMNFSLRGDVHLYRKDFSCPAGVSDAYAPVGTVVVGHATPYSTCDYVANGTASYSPPKNDVLEQSVTGNGQIRSVASVATGPDAIYVGVTPATGTDDDSFDMYMEIDRLLDNNLRETDTVSLGLEGLQCGPTHVDVWTKKTDTSVIGGCGFPFPSTDTTETTRKDIPALGWWTIHDLIEKQPFQPSYTLPPLKIPPQDVGDGISSSPWAKAVFNMTSQTSFPPDPTKGEDCMPVLG